ncbi:hypothetical protein LR48_Vigan02g108700 [Vigna angularis]|uniref:Uncharacterized protein n=1 Tax=Phaseolus angularis TaxID=3914 RepID=A0A0L9TWZ3_PHAAN|nr:hypothetical protein LR48_Vigan02g108700 [Vigna angularis]
MSGPPDHDLIAAILCIPGVNMDLGLHISQEIALIVDNDLCKLTLIIALCKDHSVLSDSVVGLQLQPSINNKFITKNYVYRVEMCALNLPPPAFASRPGGHVVRTTSFSVRPGVPDG